jgi:hypothetical protein
MRKWLVITLAMFFAAAAAPTFAQRAETYQGRLEWVPIGGTERNDVAGEGSVSAQLKGATLVVTGKFSGLPGKATGAKLHVGVAKGARGRGETVADLKISNAAAGTLSGDVPLSAEQVAALKAGRLYIQVYSEKGVLPDHSTLWAWLLP